MMAHPSQKNLAVVLFLAVFLTACGGGGGDSDNGSTSNNLQSETQDEQDSNPINESNAPTENNPQAALSANNQFSLARTSCGLGGLSVDTALDDIAIKHANYIKYVFANSTPTSFNAHVENKISNIASLTGSNNPFFGGLDFSDRLLNAKYSNAQYGVTENIAQSVYFNSAGSFLKTDVVATSMAKSLLAAPYHLRSLMLPTSSVVGSGMVLYKPDAKIQLLTKVMSWLAMPQRQKRPKIQPCQVFYLSLSRCD